MSDPALYVHVFVACRGVSWDGPAGPRTPRTLEQVAYTHNAEPPGVFPYEAEVWLFVRLAHSRPRPFARELWVTFIRRDAPKHRREVWSRPFQTIGFRPQVTVRDIAHPVSVSFEQPGLYEFRLWYPATNKWTRSPARRVIGRAYIVIEG